MKTILTLMLMAGLVSGATVNDTGTDYMNSFSAGGIFKAAYKPYTDSMGGWFWMFLIALFFVGVWIRTQNLNYATLVADIMWYLFGSMVLGDLVYVMYGLNAVILGIVVFKMFSPGYTQ